MDPTLYQSFEDDMQLHEDMARGGLRPIAHSQLPEFMSPGAPQTSNPDQLFEPSYQTVQSGPTAAPAHLHHAVSSPTAAWLRAQRPY